jgi:acyl-CoA hydrolase
MNFPSDVDHLHFALKNHINERQRICGGTVTFWLQPNCLAVKKYCKGSHVLIQAQSLLHFGYGLSPAKPKAATRLFNPLANRLL